MVVLGEDDEKLSDEDVEEDDEEEDESDLAGLGVGGQEGGLGLLALLVGDHHPRRVQAPPAAACTTGSQKPVLTLDMSPQFSIHPCQICLTSKHDLLRN